MKWVPVVLGLGGIAIESIADAQKSRFRYVLMQHSTVRHRAVLVLCLMLYHPHIVHISKSHPCLIHCIKLYWTALHYSALHCTNFTHNLRFTQSGCK